MGGGMTKMQKFSKWMMCAVVVANGISGALYFVPQADYRMANMHLIIALFAGEIVALRNKTNWV